MTGSGGLLKQTSVQEVGHPGGWPSGRLAIRELGYTCTKRRCCEVAGHAKLPNMLFPRSPAKNEPEALKFQVVTHESVDSTVPSALQRPPRKVGSTWVNGMN